MYFIYSKTKINKYILQTLRLNSFFLYINTDVNFFFYIENEICYYLSKWAIHISKYVKNSLKETLILSDTYDYIFIINENLN